MRNFVINLNIPFQAIHNQFVQSMNESSHQSSINLFANTVFLINQASNHSNPPFPYQIVNKSILCLVCKCFCILFHQVIAKWSLEILGSIWRSFSALGFIPTPSRKTTKEAEPTRASQNDDDARSEVSNRSGRSHRTHQRATDVDLLARILGPSRLGWANAAWDRK